MYTKKKFPVVGTEYKTPRWFKVGILTCIGISLLLVACIIVTMIVLIQYL